MWGYLSNQISKFYKIEGGVGFVISQIWWSDQLGNCAILITKKPTSLLILWNFEIWLDKYPHMILIYKMLGWISFHFLNGWLQNHTTVFFTKVMWSWVWMRSILLERHSGIKQLLLWFSKRIWDKRHRVQKMLNCLLLLKIWDM